MAAFNNRGNFRGGFGGAGRGGGNGGGGGGDDKRNLPDTKGKFDRYCCWCGEVVTDFALERLLRCTNNRCLRGVPIVGRRRADGLQRCCRCYSVSHRAFLYCELCGRARTSAEMFQHQLNMNGVDHNLIDPPNFPVAAVSRPVPAPAVVAGPSAAAGPAPAVVAGASAAAGTAPAAAAAEPPRAATPHENWAADEDDFGMEDVNPE